MKTFAHLLVFLTAALSSAQESNPWLRKPAGAVGIWDFSGGRLTAPTGLIGSLRSGASLSTGNKFITLDGTDDQLTVAHDSTLLLGSSFTISAWVRPSSPSGQRLIASKWNAWDGNFRSWYLRADYTTGVFEFSISRDGSATSLLVYDFASTLPTTGWHHIVLVYDDAAGANNRAKLYVNGVSVARSASYNDTSATPHPALKSTSVGGYGISDGNTILGGTSCWKGDIGSTRIYIRPITASEVMALTNEGKSRQAQGGTP